MRMNLHRSQLIFNIASVSWSLFTTDLSAENDTECDMARDKKDRDSWGELLFNNNNNNKQQRDMRHPIKRVIVRFWKIRKRYSIDSVCVCLFMLNNTQTFIYIHRSFSFTVILFGPDHSPCFSVCMCVSDDSYLTVLIYLFIFKKSVTFAVT